MSDAPVPNGFHVLFRILWVYCLRGRCRRLIRARWRRTCRLRRRLRIGLIRASRWVRVCLLCWRCCGSLRSRGSLRRLPLRLGAWVLRLRLGRRGRRRRRTLRRGNARPSHQTRCEKQANPILQRLSHLSTSPHLIWSIHPWPARSPTPSSKMYRPPRRFPSPHRPRPVAQAFEA
jgi:hypothetical protein